MTKDTQATKYFNGLPKETKYPSVKNRYSQSISYNEKSVINEKPTLKQLPKFLIGGTIVLLVLFLALIYYNFALATTIAGVVSLAANTEIELPAENQLIIEIQAVAAQKPADALIAEKTLKNVQLPVEFRISYDGNRIDTQQDYIISAKILDADQRVLLVNNQNYNVITNNHPKRVNIQLVALNAAEDPIPR